MNIGTQMMCLLGIPLQIFMLMKQFYQPTGASIFMTWGVQIALPQNQDNNAVEGYGINLFDSHRSQIEGASEIRSRQRYLKKFKSAAKLNTRV